MVSPTLAHGTEADTDANGNVFTDANLPTALGGLTYGVTNVELCAAYAAIANNGNYIKPVYYTKILDHNGNVLIENNSSRTFRNQGDHCLSSYQCYGGRCTEQVPVLHASLTIWQLQVRQVLQRITMTFGS